MHSFEPWGRAVFGLVLFAGTAAIAEQPSSSPPPVPAEYQDLYSMMQSQIASFNQTILKAWNGSKPNVSFGSELESANTNIGAPLLNSYTYITVLSELDGLKALGVKSVTVAIRYPILDPAFDAYGGNAAGYLAFYRQVAADIRARGLKMVVECGPLFTDPMYAGLNAQPFYDQLTLDQYNAGRANHTLQIARQIAPDYLSAVTEPDTEASQTGKPELGTVSGSTTLLNKIVAVYRAGGPTTVQLGAGVGTWTKDYDQYISNFASMPLDYIDMHIYPVNRDFLTRAMQIADIARAAGKKVAISEAWPQKVRDNELAIVPYTVLYGRDVFSFWAPLDQQFLQSLVHFAYYKNLVFMSAFWSEYFRGYVEYDSTTSRMNYYQLDQAATDVQSDNRRIGVFTSTGHAWERMIVPFIDLLPPTPPVLSLQSALPNRVTLSWNPSPDNIGTAGYYVYRDGTLLGATSGTSYSDTSVSDGRTYRYAAAAFDASGNTSAPSAALPVTTPDKTPPTSPSNLRATSVTSSQVNLAWTAGTDNVGVVSYRIYRGSTPSSMSLINTSAVKSYSDTLYKSGQTLCYAVAAVDARGLASPQSPSICVWIPDGKAPSVPGSLTATVLSSTQVRLAWTPSTDNVGVAGYQIQRTTGTNSPLILGATTGSTYTDSTARADTSYTYKVLAYDAAGNKSFTSAGARVMTPR